MGLLVFEERIRIILVEMGNPVKIGEGIGLYLGRITTWDVAYMEYIRHSGVVYNNVAQYLVD